MKTEGSGFSFLGGGVALLCAMMLLLGWCMSPHSVQPNAKVSFSYVAVDPETKETVASGTKKDMLLDFTGTALYQLLEGAKKDEVRTWILTDPLTQHDDSLLQKQTSVVLAEMWLPSEVGTRVTMGDASFLTTAVVTEDGVEQVVLDGNPVETIVPLNWSFTITEIK